MRFAVIRSRGVKSSVPTITLDRLIFLTVVLILLFSATAATSHFHNDLTSRSSCAICKSAQDFFSTDQQINTRLTAPVLVALPVLPVSKIKIEDISLPSKVSRAPPTA